LLYSLFALHIFEGVATYMRCPGEWHLMYSKVVCEDPEGYLYIPPEQK